MTWRELKNQIGIWSEREQDMPVYLHIEAGSLSIAGRLTTDEFIDEDYPECYSEHFLTIEKK